MRARESAESRAQPRHTTAGGDRPARHGARELHDRVGNRAAVAAARRAKIARDDERVAGDAARQAARGATRPLPFRREAEQILGADLSSIRAAVGPDATAACDALGAQAFAVGPLTVFDRDPDLATVVHEATHALQQRHAVGPLPTRLPIVSRDGAEEHEANARAAGRAARHATRGLAVAMKPKVGDAARTPGGTDLLPRAGASTKVAYLPPGTEVSVIGTEGPAYRVTVTSGPHAGKSGIVPGHVIVELPPAAKSEAVEPATDPPLVPHAALTWRQPSAASSASLPNGARVMGREHFGGGSWAYTAPGKRELPIPWHLGHNQRGLQAEPLITQEWYAPFDPDVLVPGMKAADISIGGTRTPIAGTSGPKKAPVPWQGIDIRGSTIVSYKTLDNVEHHKASGAVKRSLLAYYSDLSTPEELALTVNGTRHQISDIDSRFMHVQLRGEPTDEEAAEIADARYGFGEIPLFVMGPMSSKVTVIEAGSNHPAFAYVPPRAPESSVESDIAMQQARGNSLQFVAELGFEAVNAIGSSIQQEDKNAALAVAKQTARAHIAQNPETGASIWITWYHHDAPWFSLNHPPPLFGGVQIVYERKASSAPPSGYYKAGRHTHELVWIPPQAALSASRENIRVAERSMSKTWARIVELQAIVDRSAGEGAAEQFIRGRDMTRSFTGHEMDQPRWFYSLAKAALAEGQLDEVEQNLAKADAACDAVRRKALLYR